MAAAPRFLVTVRAIQFPRDAIQFRVAETKMLTRFFFAASAVACAFAVPLARADIYTWTDASGTINVSNMPPREGARISHLVHETPPPVAAPSDSAREAARQAELRVLSERVRELEAEANAARNPVPPDLTYAPASPPPPAIQYNVTVLPPAPQYAVEPPPPVQTCDPSWFGCGAWWGTYFYPVPVIVSRAQNFHRFAPFRGEHPNHGQRHVTTHQPLTRMPRAFRKS